ncbi:iron-containing redox enzyme family protein [Solihabitans fulvus]|uniref:Iron-containing redox enzyme family protein n=1 Tax=Solihabitans fulvus TaxID=1892852 RepID=A0A5B2XE73_9PSEU|nr:iron-containing redox enzyme family protein [Solihabitans fulvus]KAA2261405.1 iron-containing redox enzyme family protein [Solihabitans fulvus]
MGTSALQSSESIAGAVAEFADSEPYRANQGPFVRANPYHRPLDTQRLAAIDWSRRLTEDQFVSDDSLMANRLLMNVYESDALFLPRDGLHGKERAFDAFYSSRNRLLADQVRTTAEDFALGFLEDSVKVTGSWEADATLAHLERTIDEAVNADRPVLRSVETAPENKRAAEMLIAQMALDGLTEATAMSQNLGGAFGPEQSELFKIFIDEFGYGVYAAKHSTLFTDLCASTDMSADAHHYWFFYLPTSIAVNNYFYTVTHNRTGFFRYIGAMALLEATFAPWFGALGKTLRAVYGDSVDLKYCDEHAHIDQHHGRMAVHDLLMPLARKHGPMAARGLIRGVEEIRLLGALADEDLMAQLKWRPTAEKSDLSTVDTKDVVDLTAATPFETRVAERDCAVNVLSGRVDLHWRATGEPLTLTEGEAVRVPGGRLYGVRSEVDTTIAVSDIR